MHPIEAAPDKVMRVKRWAIVVIVIALAITGCSLRDPLAGPQDGPIEPGPLGLIGLWRVSDAPGEWPETWLRIDVSDMQLIRACGPIYLSWRAGSSAFVADTAAWGDGCDNNRVEWLEQAATYRQVDQGWQLLNSSGGVQASLRRDGAPKRHGETTKEMTKPPEINDAVREAMQFPNALPEGAPIVPAAAIQGTWRPAGPLISTNPHLTFSADGSYTGSDGCNKASGRWAVESTGAFLATVGPTTEIGCEGAPVHTWMFEAEAASMDGDDLVLFNAGAQEITRLTRS